MARPLKQQPVNKGRIWLLMVLGGTALFGSTVLLENNEKWFPAIFKANRALKVAQKKMEVGRWAGRRTVGGPVQAWDTCVVVDVCSSFAAGAGWSRGPARGQGEV